MCFHLILLGAGEATIQQSFEVATFLKMQDKIRDKVNKQAKSPQLLDLILMLKIKMEIHVQHKKAHIKTITIRNLKKQV